MLPDDIVPLLLLLVRRAALLLRIKILQLLVAAPWNNPRLRQARHHKQHDTQHQKQHIEHIMHRHVRLNVLRVLLDLLVLRQVRVGEELAFEGAVLPVVVQELHEGGTDGDDDGYDG